MRTMHVAIAIATSLMLMPAAAAAAATTSAAVPAVGTTAATTARVGPAVVTVDGPAAFSPNGDHRKDNARFNIDLARRAAVTVTVVRGNRAQTVVVRERLGDLRAGSHGWTWDGRKDSGSLAADAYYYLEVKAVRLDGSVHKAWVSTALDTAYRVGEVTANGDTVYPRTTVVHDRVWFGSTSEDSHKPWGTLVVRNGDGREVFRDTRRLWRGGRATSASAVAWDGRNENDRPVKPGRYWVRIHGSDRAGNSGRTPRFGIDVSAAPLVEASGSRTVTPKETWQGPAGAGPCGPTSGNDCGVWEPCGEVVDSTTFTEPGSLSYRSDDTCPESYRPHLAYGRHVLALDPAASPRGVRTARLTMVGGPTRAGESDQGYLGLWSGQATPSGPDTSVHATSTPTETNPWPEADAQVGWYVQTNGDDAYDVISFTVDYTYLTPRG